MAFSFQSLHFKPAVLPTLAALATVCLTGYLGHWQQGRASLKREMQLEFDARRSQSPVLLNGLTRDLALQYRRAVATGDWHAPGQIFVDNQVRDGVAGYHVITPLKLEGTDTYVLVNRGWISRGSTYPLPPFAGVLAGRVTQTGQLSLPSSRFLELSAHAVDGVVWQNMTIERYRDASKLDMLPFVLLADDVRAPLKPVAERPDARAEKNVEYMLTWYSLATTTIVLWVVLNLKIVRAHDSRNASVLPPPSPDEGIES